MAGSGIIKEVAVIDFEDCSILHDQCDKSALQKAGTDIVKAFQNQSTGFIYLKNHGISEAEVDHIFKVSGAFFDLPEATKNKYCKTKISGGGWLAPWRESLNPDKLPDLKEAFDYEPTSPSQPWPNQELLNFKTTFQNFYANCSKLALRMVEAMAYGLNIDPNFLLDCHKKFGKAGNTSTLKALYYPPVTSEDMASAARMRCGDHTDYGSLTFLLQDDIDGLQVRNLQGDYIDITPLPGAFVVNVGDLLERWTADRLVAGRHRVLLPKRPEDLRRPRRSVVFFVIPDDDVIIKCLDGSSKYEPITTLDFMNMKFRATYN